MELTEIGVVDRITIFNRKDFCGPHVRPKNMRVTVGFTELANGMNTLENEICAIYEGPGKNGEEISIDCNGMKGKYVSFQLMQETKTILNLAEIEIYGHPAGNVFKYFKRICAV